MAPVAICYNLTYFLPSSIHTFISVATEHSSNVWVAFLLQLAFGTRCNWIMTSAAIRFSFTYFFNQSLTNTFMPVGTLQIYIVVIGLYLLLPLYHAWVVICFCSLWGQPLFSSEMRVEATFIFRARWHCCHVVIVVLHNNTNFNSQAHWQATHHPCTLYCFKTTCWNHELSLVVIGLLFMLQFGLFYQNFSKTHQFLMLELIAQLLVSVFKVVLQLPLQHIVIVVAFLRLCCKQPYAVFFFFFNNW
jgi:hypothetical protein